MTSTGTNIVTFYTNLIIAWNNIIMREAKLTVSGINGNVDT